MPRNAISSSPGPSVESLGSARLIVGLLEGLDHFVRVMVRVGRCRPTRRESALVELSSGLCR